MVMNLKPQLGQIEYADVRCGVVHLPIEDTLA